jgi:hypothetical protein
MENQLFDNNIDFDEASKCWRENKKKTSNGCFVYICNHKHSNNKRCRRTIQSQTLKNDYVYGFGGVTNFDKNMNHVNADIFCKKHLNRCCK